MKLRFTAIVPRQTRRVGPQGPEAVNALKKWPDRVIAKVAKYPPPPPASTYERTGRLGKGWRKEFGASFDGGLAATVRNNVPYAPWVQSEPTQTWFHQRTGWKTVQEAGAEAWDEIAPDLERIMGVR